MAQTETQNMTPTHRPTAEQLASAIREGLESRCYYRPPSPGRLPAADGTPHDPSLALTPLTAVPLSQSFGHRGRLVRALRRAARKVLRPILEHQSSTNAALARQVTSLAESDHVVAARFAEMASRIEELTRRLQDLEHEVGTRLAPPDAGPGRERPGPAAAADRHGVAEGLFLQTRLPAPPARVLTLSLDHAADLSQLGYQVVAAALGGAAGLPFADAAFEAVVATGWGGPDFGPSATGRRVVDELLRVLVPGGRLIGSIRFDTPPTGAEVADRVAPLRVTDLRYSSWSGEAWVLHPEPTPGSRVALWVAARP